MRRRSRRWGKLYKFLSKKFHFNSIFKISPCKVFCLCSLSSQPSFPPFALALLPNDRRRAKGAFGQRARVGEIRQEGDEQGEQRGGKGGKVAKVKKKQF